MLVARLGCEDLDGVAHLPEAARPCDTVGFHNFNLRIFNLRVSNPDKFIVDVFFTRCRISMCQGVGPKKHDENSEIDRMLFSIYNIKGIIL